MKFLKKLLAPVLLGLSAAALSVSAWAAPVYKLGFALDASGSVSTSNYNLLRSGLSAALGAISQDGSIEISIVSYSSSVTTVVAPTVLTAATLPAIQSAIATHAKSGSTTNTAGAITALTTLMGSTGGLLDANVKSIINLATDGFPDSQSASVAAAVAAAAAGVDALSIEAIGSGVSSASALNDLAKIAFPTPVTILPLNSTSIPNPLEGSFVVPVSDFDALAPVLLAKVKASVNETPEPGTVLLLSLGLVGLGFASRRKAA